MQTSNNKSKWKKKKTARLVQDYHTSAEKSSVKRDMSKKYLLVDGYNIIYAWDDLKELLDTNVDAARGKLLDEMSNYQGMKGMELIVVFDAYRVKGHETENHRLHEYSCSLPQKKQKQQISILKNLPIPMDENTM